MNWPLIVSLLVNLAVIFLFVRDRSIERRDMLDRLMSRDLVEYKGHIAPPPEPSTPVNMTDEEEWAREIEMMKPGAR